MMTVPQLMVKIWDGDQNEYFTYMDMNRVEYNANICAREAGVAQASFIETTRASQFRYDEAQKLENLLLSTAQALGLTISIESAWSYNRTVSYVDFERWESNLWQIYQALGGVGERIPSDKFLITSNTTLFKNEWLGTGPYYMDKDIPSIYSDTEAVAYVNHTATVLQRAAEYNAVLRVVPNGDRKVRVYSLSIKPKEDIPIKVTIGGFRMHQVINLPASGWTGSGPWTQNVTIQNGALDAVIGQHEGMTAQAVEQMMYGMLHVSAIIGNTVTVRVIGQKPTIDLNPMILWNEDVVE